MADIRVKIDGDASDLIRELDKVERAADDVDDAARRTGDGLGALGDRADVGETRIMGLRDSVDGLGAIMAGPGEQGISSYLQGWADMASGVVNFIVPTLKNLSKQLIANAAQAIKSSAAHVVAAGKMVVGWIAMGVQSTIAAAKVAAAWLISMGPIAAVVAAVVGLVVVIVKNWDTIKEWISKGWEFVKGVTRRFIDFMVGLFMNWTLPGLIIKHWDTIKNAAVAVKDWVVEQFAALVNWFRSLPSKMGEVLGGIAQTLLAPFKAAFNAIARAWNHTIGSLSFTVPSWVPGIGGRGWNVPDIPTFHTGGVFRAATAGGEGLALLRDGETVTPAGGGVTVNFYGFVGSELQLAQEIDRLLTRRSRTAGLGFA